MEAEDEEENKGKRTCVPRQKKNLTNEELAASSAAKAHFLTKKSFQAFLLDALGPRRRLSAATVHQNGFAGPQCPCRCPRWSRIFPLEVCSVITRVRALGLMRVRQVGTLHMDIRLVLLECIGVVVVMLRRSHKAWKEAKNCLTQAFNTVGGLSRLCLKGGKRSCVFLCHVRKSTKNRQPPCVRFLHRN